MQSVLAMFPGQGSQYVGMGKKLLTDFPYVTSVFEEAEEACQLNIRRLCQEGPDEDLRLTANTQPCLLTVSVAYWRALQEEVGLRPALFAGHSLGEYSALVAAGKLELARAAYLVKKRGEAMQEAVPAGVGAMAAVLRIGVSDLEALCEKHSKPGSRVEIANYNSDAQLVVAGHAEAVKALSADLQTQGIRSVDLPVSAPFHSSLMKPARDEMEPLILASKFHKNDNGIIANLTGEVVRDYKPSNLIQQIDSPVRWIQSIESAKTEAMTHYIEIGPGKVLFGLVRRMVPKDSCEVLASDELTDLLPRLASLPPLSATRSGQQGDRIPH